MRTAGSMQRPKRNSQPTDTIFHQVDHNQSVTKDHSRTVDTGQKFKNGCPKAYFFKAYTKVKNPKVGSFLRAPEDFEGLGSLKN